MTGPFDEVVQMIQKMIFRLMAEQKDEDDHKNWCDLELEKTNTSKVDKEDKIAELTAKINQAEATVQLLTEDIAAADEMVSQIVAHMKEATEIREIGKTENAAAVKDAQDAQTALANAIAVLEAFYKESGMIPKESYELLQRQPVSLPESPSTWDASYTGVMNPADPETGIITVLQTVSADFARMEADTNAQEATDQKEFEEDMQDCDIEKARRTKESQVKNAEKKRLVDKIASLTASRKQTSNELEAVMQYLKDLQPACVTGDSDYDTRKAARATEIQALQDAQGILQDAFKESAAPAPAAASFLHRRKIA
jgi:chromosome segregation ATPase